MKYLVVLATFFLSTTLLFTEEIPKKTREKNLDFCFECSDYPCKNLDDFKNDKNCPYHNEIFEYMEIIRNEGRESWIDKMKVRWSCSSCGSEFSWWDETCKECGNKTSGYKNPNSGK